MKTKKINPDKVLNSIANEEKFQKAKMKLVYFNTELTEGERDKLCELVQKSKEKVIQLKTRIKNA